MKSTRLPPILPVFGSQTLCHVGWYTFCSKRFTSVCSGSPLSFETQNFPSKKWLGVLIHLPRWNASSSQLTRSITSPPPLHEMLVYYGIPRGGEGRLQTLGSKVYCAMKQHDTGGQGCDNWRANWMSDRRTTSPSLTLQTKLTLILVLEWSGWAGEHP